MMRLIDADALKESIVTGTLEEDRKTLNRRFCYPCREILAAIDNAPTVERRKTGHWLMDEIQRAEDVNNGNYLYVCSECGHSDVHAKGVVVPFCWCCGAKMEG